MIQQDSQSYEHVLDDAPKEQKRAYWEIAFGLQAVDDLQPSAYMRELAEQHIDGTKTYAEVTEEISSYYRQNEKTPTSSSEHEADIVADAIYGILHDEAFRFDILTYKSYHRRLFEKLEPEIYHPGEFRTVNLTKKEPILDGKSVQYQDFGMIEESLKYDFDEEARQDYLQMSDAEKVQRLATFISRIWQVHPFYEGNTRTTAVFLEKYLMSMGYEVDNELLEKHAKDFRNALVLANYTSIPDGVQASMEKLEDFVKKMLEK